MCSTQKMFTHKPCGTEHCIDHCPENSFHQLDLISYKRVHISFIKYFPRSLSLSATYCLPIPPTSNILSRLSLRGRSTDWIKRSKPSTSLYYISVLSDQHKVQLRITKIRQTDWIKQSKPGLSDNKGIHGYVLTAALSLKSLVCFDTHWFGSVC